jgi:aldehyde dehydrogenase (NAD+)
MMTVHGNYVASEWVTSGTSRDNINPSDLSDVVGTSLWRPGPGRDRRWRPPRRLPGVERQHAPAALRRAGRRRYEILARKEELGRLLSREEGKTLPEGIGEVARAGRSSVLRRRGAARAGRDRASVRPASASSGVTREPLGVIAIISPWNFPSAHPGLEDGAALAFGNCVVIKPADAAPGSAWALAEDPVALRAAQGVFNLVKGRGSVVGPRR